MTWIFTVKIALSSELIHDIFVFIEKTYSLRRNVEFGTEDRNNKLWHRTRKICHRIFFHTYVKLSDVKTCRR